MKKRVFCIILTAVLLVNMFPISVFAAHDSTGKPLDLTGDVYLALYIGGSDFPGEPAEHAVSGYLNLNSAFGSNGFGKFAESAENILHEDILDDVVQGTSGVWGVFSTTGGSRYLLPSSKLVDGAADDVNKPHNAETEKKIIQTAIDNGNFRLGSGESIDDYTIVWYVIKYQRSDSAWHIDGLITKKSTYSVNYYGNGNTSGGAPTGQSGMKSGETHTVLGNTGDLRKVVGGDSYIFNGWNTSAEGNGIHYDAGDQITIDNSNVTLYAEWYLQNKYTATVVTKLNGVETNADDIWGDGSSLYIEMHPEGGEMGELIPLKKGTAGTYTATVTENGAYHIWLEDANGNQQRIEDYQITIYNQNGSAELQYYSVSYDTNAGADTVTWEGQPAPETTNYPVATPVTDAGGKPVREGYTFLYWLDQDNNPIYPGQIITSSLTEKTVLTAQWEENIDITVEVIINHNSTDGGVNNAISHEVLLQFLREENGVNLPLDRLLLNESRDEWEYDDPAGKTTYTLVKRNVPQGIYKVLAEKQMYEVIQKTHTVDADGNQHILVELQYAPEDFDLTFDVKVNWDNEAEKKLLPIAVNVKVLYWGYNDGELGWHTITQQAGNSAPTTVYIDQETGMGTGSYSVWKYWDAATMGEEYAYEYRIEVKSFVMPDGRVIPATGNLVTYRPDGSGLYTAKISVEGDGRFPTKPGESNLEGAYFDGNTQNGIPTATIDIRPYLVYFNAGAGKLENKQQLELKNQYIYPDLNQYIPVPDNSTYSFVGWFDIDGNPVQNLAGTYLQEDVYYYAEYSQSMSVQGTITVAGTYKQNGETVNIKDVDRAKNVMVVLQKNVNGQYVDVKSYEATITYDHLGADGFGDYNFTNIAQDGAQYRIVVLSHNYVASYDNESDVGTSYSPEEYIAVLGGDAIATVHAYMEHAPESYVQYMEVDASRIGEKFRPTGALAEILYRDLGDIYPYDVISQHTVDPFGKNIALSPEGFGNGSESVWQYHTDGTLYEYQMNVTTLYGNVDGVFNPAGTDYNSDTAPFIIEYDPASRYSPAAGGQSRTLKATLIPKEYKITFDLQLEPGETVSGMDQYLTDSVTGESYIYHHTWSKSAQFSAYPYRSGYVFEGWECEIDGVDITNGGQVYVDAALAEDLVLVAKWRQVTGTSYVVRHLELNTDKPLKGAFVADGIVAGTVVTAAKEVADIKGYEYAAAKVGGRLYTVEENAQMTVTADAENVMIIYYLPDGSNGYTDQVESNLKLDKQATLEDNGTYTINLETYTLDNPVTTMILQNTPLDIVLVLDQSGSLAENNKSGLLALQNAVDTFVEAIADHGRHNEVDHRIALVGYASNETDGTTSTNATQNPYSGGVVSSRWTNTGVFDSNGEFHLYSDVKGFNYTLYNGSVTPEGTYYTYSEAHKAYLLLTHHEEYRHLITEEQAREAVLEGTAVYGYVYDDKDVGSFVELERNSSGMWLYGDRKLYSHSEFFTYHTDVWTHRHNLEPREIHAYGTGSNYKETDGHTGVYTRTETSSTTHQLSVYQDALIPVSVGANGSGGTNPGLIKSTEGLGANGGTRASYGMEMANEIFKANPHNGDRVRVVVMFTDGQPGQSGFLASEANAAISSAYTAKHEYGAYVYTIGLYTSAGVDADSDIAYYMNALSSNYPDAKSMADIKSDPTYVKAEDGDNLNDGVARYVEYDGTYYQLKYGKVKTVENNKNANCWYFTVGRNNRRVSTLAAPTITGGMVGNYVIYEYKPAGYKETEKSGYYSTTESTLHLEEYFANVMKDITTNITTEIVLHSDTILRDIMGQGLVLTENSVITAYKINGAYNANGEIEWEDSREEVAKVSLKGQTKDTVYSSQTTSISYKIEDGTTVTRENVPYISVYNLNAANATNPNGKDYHPHTVDITGYDFETGYITPEHPGYKLIAEITCVEATDDVQWGRSTATNNEQSGLWLPKDAQGDRKLLLPFDQPTTIFVERAYVLDYGKSFDLSGWYFDDEKDDAGNVIQNAVPIHLDCDIESGMNYFSEPNKSNAVDGQYGNTDFGNVEISGETVTYTPTTMNWGGLDSFYVFGKTWRRTVLAQDANENRNLWNKVTVIPANNIYYEDSFITKPPKNQENGVEGFQFTGDWEIVYDNGQENAGQNVENPEYLESAPYGDVHGWTDSLGNDKNYTDGSAHAAGLESLGNRIGATAKFTFTGTGVDVFSRTKGDTGLVIAILYQHVTDDQGAETLQLNQAYTMDNLAVSGDYYHVPTISFHVPYGTYTVELVATVASAVATGALRYEYYLDGVRVYNPLGTTTNYQSGVVKTAYGLENNATFTEVRDILLDYGDFNTGLTDGDDKKMGAVFIDWIREGQGTGNDEPGKGEATYEIGTFESYGPKNEVYLSAGQAIVLKVEKGNNYYVGMKSLTGNAVTVNVSGIDLIQAPVSIEIAHSTDMYYRVNPIDGYIVIQNGNTEGDEILSITNLRTTNQHKPATNGGVLPVKSQTAVMMMRSFSRRLQEQENNPMPEEPTEELTKPNVQTHTQETIALATALFSSVRQWLDSN